MVPWTKGAEVGLRAAFLTLGPAGLVFPLPRGWQWERCLSEDTQIVPGPAFQVALAHNWT